MGREVKKCDGKTAHSLFPVMLVNRGVISQKSG